MKSFNITLLAALISAPLAAETIDKTWELGVFADYINSSTTKERLNNWQQIEDGKSFGIDIQKVLNENWNARFELAKTRYDINNGNANKYGNRYGFDAIYKLDDSNLYVFGGVRRFNNVKSYNAVDIGAGYNFEVSDRFSFYTEAASYRDINNGYTDLGLKISLKYTFGETKSAPIITKAKKVAEQPIKKMVVLDSDNDGVNDKNDRCADTPTNVKVNSVGCTLYAEKEVSMKLDVAFENNSSQLKASMIDDIQRLADFMQKYPETSVTIEGHSSATGNADYNLMLSQKRADAVKKTLINKFNVAESRLVAKGFGQTQLLSEGTTKADNALNRRVVAKIETVEKEIVYK